MADLINRDEQIYSIVNRQVTTPDFVGDGVAEFWRNGYVTCQHDILDIIENAKPVALGTDRAVINWTPDLDKFARDVAYRAMNEFSFMGKSLLEWVDIILEQYAMKTQSGWISVQDRLPEKDGDYLAYAFGFVDRLRFADGVWWDYGAECQPGAVTHWMALPEPPEEVSGDAAD